MTRSNTDDENSLAVKLCQKLMLDLDPSMSGIVSGVYDRGR